LVVIFYLCSGCLGFEVFSAGLFSVQRWVVSGKLARNKNLFICRNWFLLISNVCIFHIPQH